jgi:hypothetical protein
MNNILVIGAPGQGKTPFVRTMIENNRCFVFDIQNEYGDRTKYKDQKKVLLSNNVNAERARYTGINMDEFVNLCSKKRDTICVFEEATAFFQGRTKDRTTRHLINRYHTGNVSIFLFHSINSVPPRLMEMANFVVLFKTLDEIDTVYRKYNRLAMAFQDLEESPDGTFKIIKLI